ncbi:MAG: IS1634 family transposase [Erysipelotrichaceae bacterium]|nr:IS1634 family transposase [Erysipelotrichaceae bacterium]
MGGSKRRITPYRNGKAGLIAGLCQAIGVDQIFNELLTPEIGRPPEIAYGDLAQMFLMSMGDEHHPLSRLVEYLETLDLEALIKCKVDKNQLNDDRFGGFLDLMHQAGGAEILSRIAVSAFNHYGILLKSVNYDTTSKIMWGEYQTQEGVVGTIDITFGHSKQHRPDKKQMILSMGTTQGICIDGRVHSGNQSDKTYNIENLDRAVEMKARFKTDDESPFFYIADSAAFTKVFLEKARLAKMDVITRMPDNINACKLVIEKALDRLESLPTYEFPSSTTPSVYQVMSDQCVYEGIPLSLGVCYSQKLESTKFKLIHKQVLKERDTIEAQLKILKKRPFVCSEDANLEIEKLNKTMLKKAKYHTVSFQITEQNIKRPGRPSKDPALNSSRTEYTIHTEIEPNQAAIDREIQRECIFVVASTDVTMSGVDILREYKTQSAVERKFQFLKSPQFVNALYVDSPRRAESLGYLMLILILLLSVGEHVVRREMEKESARIVGPGNKILTRPSLIAIFRIFYSVQTIAEYEKGVAKREFTEELRPNVRDVMRYLGIPEEIFTRNS